MDQTGTSSSSEIEHLIDQLVTPDDLDRQLLVIQKQVQTLTPADLEVFARAMKDRVDVLMRKDLSTCLLIIDHMDTLARLSGDPITTSLALIARGNANIVAMGKYREGLSSYQRAEQILSKLGMDVEVAKIKIAKVYTLGNLGKYTQAEGEYQWADSVLEEQEEWFHQARLKINMAINYARLGQDTEALDLFDGAKAAYRKLGYEGTPEWLRLELNRAVILRNLGRFEEAIAASQSAIEGQQQLGQEVAAARAKQSLALTYFLQGKYNEALSLLDHARQVLLQDGRQRHAILVELFISDCLLQLRRFHDVLEKCRQVRELFSQLGTRFEVGQAILNEASAYAGLERYDEALHAVRDARKIFAEEGNQAATAQAELQGAMLYLKQNRPEESLLLANQTEKIFSEHDMPVWEARALLVGASAALEKDEIREAEVRVQRAMEIGEQHNLSDLTFACHYLLSQMEKKREHPEAALASIENALVDLEQLTGKIMIEFRADFLGDKGRLYEDAVALSLETDQIERALNYTERAKSRALLDMLAYRLDMSILARDPADEPIVAELIELRRKRDQGYRRLFSGEGYGQRGESAALDDTRQLDEQRVLSVEKRITDLWHRLLIRNADYARDAAMWQVRTEPVQPYLQADEMLLEFFVLKDRLVVFLIDAKDIQAAFLPTTMPEIKLLLQALWLNLRSVPGRQQNRSQLLEENAQGILRKLYRILIDPIGDNLIKKSVEKLVIVPHGPLHYLPFQALYDGDAYLIDRYEISYLPGSSFLRYVCETQPTASNTTVVGHSFGTALPYTIEEAISIAEFWQGSTLLEDDATLEAVQEAASNSRIIHIAAHANFRPDNPLFSGIALADGWMTTLDIFGLRLDASLVTLSACQTGRSIVGGGDELLGLMRAFLAAGTSSLVATHWSVEDRSTAQLMQNFYRKLHAGASKGSAIRQAQVEMLHSDSHYRHPYYWASFYLVGASRAL